MATPDRVWGSRFPLLGSRWKKEAQAGSSYDKSLLAVICSLALLGLVMVYSARMPSPLANADAPLMALFRGHGLYLVISGVAMLIMTNIPISVWERNARRVFILGLALLFGVCCLKFFAAERFTIDGGVRFLPIGPFTLQPAELMKLFALIYAADYATRRASRLQDLLKGFGPIAIALGVVSTMLLYQPDMGSTMVIVAIVMGILFLAGMQLRMFVVLTILLLAFFAALVYFTPWRLARLIAYLTPCDGEQIKNTGYQLCVGLTAFGHGALFGVGLGSSIAKLGHLPLPHSDFIFAVIGEELGFAGIAAVLFGFLFITRRTFEIGREAWAFERSFAGLAAQGVAVWIGVQALIHTGVNVGLFPTKGLTLPLISHGGSSLLATALALGLVLRIDIENRRLMRSPAAASTEDPKSRRPTRGRV